MTFLGKGKVNGGDGDGSFGSPVAADSPSGATTAGAVATTRIRLPYDARERLIVSRPAG